MLLAFAACGDAPTATGPGFLDRPALAVAPEVAPATEALRDALERIAPTLGRGPAATALQRGLGAAVNAPTPAALSAVEAVLSMLELEQPDAAVEVEVIRLALAAQR
jgi:hypothetical protein